MKSEIKAFAKVNLFLDITGRLENGYHTLNTVMQQIDLYDEITAEVSEGNGIYISCDNPAVPCNEKNIAYKAAAAFLSETGKKARVDIRIKKNIPLEAGMGGSSTDGAAVLKALNEIYGYPLTDEKLCEIGTGLGADVPFCITGGTAVCKGIGEIMTPVQCLKDYVFLIVKPDFSCFARSDWDGSPVITHREPKPMRVRNISICSGVVFCASSKITNAFPSVRPRMNASGAISITPREISSEASAMGSIS